MCPPERHTARLRRARARNPVAGATGANATATSPANCSTARPHKDLTLLALAHRQPAGHWSFTPLGEVI